MSWLYSLGSASLSESEGPEPPPSEFKEAEEGLRFLEVVPANGHLDFMAL